MRNENFHKKALSKYIYVYIYIYIYIYLKAILTACTSVAKICGAKLIAVKIRALQQCLLYERAKNAASRSSVGSLNGSALLDLGAATGRCVGAKGCLKGLCRYTCFSLKGTESTSEKY